MMSPELARNGSQPRRRGKNKVKDRFESYVTGLPNWWKIETALFRTGTS